MSGEISATFIIEILGRPPEHLKDSLQKLVEQLGNEKGVKIIESLVQDPKKLEQEKPESEEEKEKAEKFKEVLEKDKNITVTHDIFTTFAEVEAEFDSLDDLLMVAFNYMPSNVEITKPENFLLKNSDISHIVSNTIIKLHRYDEIAKKLTVDKTVLENRLKEVLEKKD